MKFAIPVLVVAISLGTQGSDRFQDMTVVKIGPVTSTIGAPKGIIWKQEIKHPDEAVAIRVHILVRTPNRTPDWAIRIRDLSGRHVDTFQGNSDLLTGGEVWSSEVRDRGAIVELLADVEGVNPQIVVDRYAFRARAKSSVGPPALALIPVFEAPFEIQAWAEPVARLRFIEEGRQFTCTGFLVHRTLIMTAGFCARTETVAVSMIADFGFDSARTTPKSIRVKNLEVSSTTHDYAVLRLADAPDGFRPATLAEARAINGQSIVIIQHPAGEAKQVSAECKVANAALQGAGAATTDLGHECATLGGSSGSPVIDRQSGRVLGVHRLGKGKPDDLKQAVQAAEILTDLKQRAPRLYEELMTPQSKK